MNHTTNYNLPQWEDTDRVTRADMNAAMSTIDTAIKAAGGWIALKTLSLSGRSATIDLSDIDFAAYRAIHLVYHVTQGWGSWRPMFNTAELSSVSLYTSRNAYLALFPMYSSESRVCGMVVGSTAQQLFGLDDLIFSALTEFTMKNVSNFEIANAVLTVYGEK